MRWLIVDDHPIVRTSFRYLVDAIDPQAQIEECGSLDDALAACESHDPDIVILDVMLPNCQGLTSYRRLKPVAPTTAFVLMSGDESASLMQTALKEGVSGFIPKSSSATVIKAALEVVVDGGIYVPPAALGLAAPQARRASVRPPAPEAREAAGEALTARQRQILDLLAHGMSNGEIAQALGVAEQTVKNHVSRLFRQLGVTNRAQAALRRQRMRQFDTARRP